MTMQSPAERDTIRGLGRDLGPDVLAAVQALYRDEQTALAAGRRAVAVDLAYGDDPRQRLDIYAPDVAGAPWPILVWVHGGGFLRGEKSSPDHPYSAHAGQWAARHGMLGVVINYRLAPDHAWPAGSVDVGLTVDWLRAHADWYGGDPEHIILAGTSAGATHVAAYLARQDTPGVVGAVLLSALYGVTPPSDRDLLYYGDAADYPARRPLDAALATTVPLLVAGAEYDPPRFQEELAGFLAGRLARHGMLPRTMIVPGHNHFSLASHLGTRDTRLADEILAFVHEITGDAA